MMDRQLPHLPGQAAAPPRANDLPPCETDGSPSDVDKNRIKVLVADDDPTNRLIFHRALSKMGYVVSEAVDGWTALEEVERDRPDVILMDVMMPNMDGLECTRRLKSSASTRDIPIIIASACTDASDIAAGLAAGADEYAGKPLRPAELCVRINSVVRLYRHQHAAMRTAEVEAVAKALQAELAQRRKMETELRQAKEDAEKASHAKSDFLATMSHELRTPLNGVIGMMDLLLRTNLSELQRRYATVAKHSGDTLLCLINDILDFSKIEAGKVELEQVNFDLQDTVESVILTLEQRAAEKGLVLDRSIHPHMPPRVVGDPGRIQQVLMNLVSNAIKFTESGRITVRATVEEQTSKSFGICFTVNDTGVGIPADKIEHLFQAFQQLDASTTRKYGGTGLGLAICRRLVELMGGTIGVSSELGLGSTFWFTVVLDYAPGDEAIKQSDPIDLRRVRVLAVDDNEVNREVLSAQFTDAGIAVELVPDAHVALARLRDSATNGTPFDVVVLDRHLPEIDGFQLAQRIKSDPLIQNAVLLLFSSGNFAHDENVLRRAGFSSWLQKPATQTMLLDAVATALACATRVAAPDRDIGKAFVHVTESATELSGVRVLLADDNQIGREVASATLAMLGCQVDVVCDGLEALDAVSTSEYDLILMDCQMPNLDGFDATRQIRLRDVHGRGAPAARAIPIVALTANAVKGDRRRCLDAGMDDYLAKPFQADELAAVIKRLVLGAGTDAADDRSPPFLAATDVEDAAPGPDKTRDDDADPFHYEELMTRWGGNHDSVVKLVRMFQAHSPELVADLERHVDRADSRQMVHAAHSLKGAAAYVSADAVRRIAAELEEMGKASDFGDAAVAVQSLRAELERCLAFDPGAFPTAATTSPPARDLPPAESVSSHDA